MRCQNLWENLMSFKMKFVCPLCGRGYPYPTGMSGLCGCGARKTVLHLIHDYSNLKISKGQIIKDPPNISRYKPFLHLHPRVIRN